MAPIQVKGHVTVTKKGRGRFRLMIIYQTCLAQSESWLFLYIDIECRLEFIVKSLPVKRTIYFFGSFL